MADISGIVIRKKGECGLVLFALNFPVPRDGGGREG
uniref:Uncharacterized protein n=1 Tax=Anguilla anguilla TaxID=7936 RepID=A0A0E9PF18_ANGAN